MSFNSLYNKFRPASFHEVIGQDHICKVIEKHLEEGTLPHSLILYGPIGTGKTSVGRIIANKLNPTSFGLVERDATVESRMEDIRALQSEVVHLPMEGDYITFIFDEAHRIGNKSFDSLLKTIEEPPVHIKFIFVTSQFDQVPDSIKSRSQCHCFRLLDREEIATRISYIAKKEKIELSSQLLDFIIDSSSGSMRNAIVSLEKVSCQLRLATSEEEILRSLGIVGTKSICDFISSFIFEDFVEMEKISSNFSAQHLNISTVVYDLEQSIMDIRYALLYRDTSMLNSGKIDLVTKILNTFEDKEKLRILGRRLDLMFEATLQLDKIINFVSNKEALFKKYVIDLGLVWKQQV